MLKRGSIYAAWQGMMLCNYIKVIGKDIMHVIIAYYHPQPCCINTSLFQQFLALPSPHPSTRESVESLCRDGTYMLI